MSFNIDVYDTSLGNIIKQALDKVVQVISYNSFEICPILLRTVMCCSEPVYTVQYFLTQYLHRLYRP